MPTLDCAGVAALLARHDRFLLTTHENPDGDAVGTMLALYHFLREMGKEHVQCVCADAVPRAYRWLPGADTIRFTRETSGAWDLVVLVDVARFDRIGDAADLFENSDNVLILDHHLETAPDGRFHHISPAYAACSEIIVELYQAAGMKPSLHAALCAYVGIATDTGGFRYGNTNAGAHRRAAQLVDAGVNVLEVSGRLFDTMSQRKFALLRRVLDRMRFTESGACAYTFLTERDMEETGATSEDSDGLVNYARNIEGVHVGILFRELSSGHTKVSMRSKGLINSAEILRSLGGGGHAGAAGALLELPLEAAQDAVLEGVREALSEPVS
ncbi:MAG: bifunctional oligoribonuclease/PAP phosphatase NrnA [Candidatus Hydrogenedentales bacterium]